jgi:hypothetical protein
MRLHLRKQEGADLIGFLAEEGEFDAVLSLWHAETRSLNLKVLHTMPSADVERFLLHMGFTVQPRRLSGAMASAGSNCRT